MIFSVLENAGKEKRDNQKVVSLFFGSLNRLEMDFSSSGVPDMLMDESKAKPGYVTRTDFQYSYNGVEWQDELGLNMYAMDMRQYDPAIARWIVLDPVIHHSLSPYNAFDNNPVFWADPSGADAVDIGYDRTISSQDMMGSYHWSGGFQEIENEGGDKKDTVFRIEWGDCDEDNNYIIPNNPPQEYKKK